VGLIKIRHLGFVEISFFIFRLPNIRLLLCFAVLAVLPFNLSLYGKTLLVDAFAYGVLAMSLDFVLGYGGMISFGHACYYGIGAYTVILALIWYQIPICFSFPLALTLAGLYGLLVGFFSARLGGFYFAMTTLAFSEVIHRWFMYTSPDIGAPYGSFIFGRWLDPLHYYYFALALLFGSYLVLRRIINSPFGKVLVATGLNEERMMFIGYNTRRVRITAFVISTVFAGVAGAMFPGNHGFADIHLMNPTHSELAIVAVFLGGVGTLVGPIIGGIFITIYRDILATYWLGYLMAEGVMLALVIIFVPKGFYGTLKDYLYRKYLYYLYRKYRRLLPISEENAES